jgi:hypothetical protein
MYLASNIGFFFFFLSFRSVGNISAGWVCSLRHTEKNYKTLFSPLLVVTFTTNGSPSYSKITDPHTGNSYFGVS